MRTWQNHCHVRLSLHRDLNHAHKRIYIAALEGIYICHLQEMVIVLPQCKICVGSILNVYKGFNKVLLKHQFSLRHLPPQKGFLLNLNLKGYVQCSKVGLQSSYKEQNNFTVSCY